MSNKNNYLNEEIIRKKKKRLRKESMDEIVSQNLGWFPRNPPRIELILSVRDYPYVYQMLKFNHEIFDAYFKKLPERSFILDGIEYKLFDPEGEINNNESWMNISEKGRYPASIIIKLDGTIYTVFKLNGKGEEIVKIKADWLQSLLSQLFEVIIEIYSKMSYSGDKLYNVHIVNFLNCKILEGYPGKLYSSEVSEKYFENLVIHNDHSPLFLSNNLFNRLRRLFSFTPD